MNCPICNWNLIAFENTLRCVKCNYYIPYDSELEGYPKSPPMSDTISEMLKKVVFHYEKDSTKLKNQRIQKISAHLENIKMQKGQESFERTRYIIQKIIEAKAICPIVVNPTNLVTKLGGFEVFEPIFDYKTRQIVCKQPYICSLNHIPHRLMKIDEQEFFFGKEKVKQVTSYEFLDDEFVDIILHDMQWGHKWYFFYYDLIKGIQAIKVER